MKKKGSVLIDVALILLAVMVAVAVGTRYPLGAGGYVITGLFAYVTVSTLYHIVTFSPHVPKPRFSHHASVLDWGVWWW
jgi:hypothetical protein